MKKIKLDDKMDMGGMDMSGMAGMDHGSSGLFTGTNTSIARSFWYAMAAITALLVAKRMANAAISRHRLRRSRDAQHCNSCRPQGWLSQAYATATATLRELAYSQPWYFTGPFRKYFTPLPIGRWLGLVVYWVAILTFLWANTILRPDDAMYAYKWEKVGFRAAWVSVMQIPLVFLLSTKFNPFSLLTGISYERLNWIHRWTARTVFLTVIVHWSFFFREWVLADFVKMQLQMMPMVRYGFGAFAVLGWNVVSSFGYFRAKAYELFVAQHICAAAALLWLLHKHLPSDAKYNVYLSIGFVAFDWGARLIWIVLQNLHVLSKFRVRMPGYNVELEPLAGEMVRVKVQDADFQWKSGQHLYLSIPYLRPLEAHPFTIANAWSASQDGSSAPLNLIVKAHKGFSKSLHTAAVRNLARGHQYRAFLNGPWGIPPNLQHYESVVLIAASSGASFVIPLLHDIVKKKGCVRRATLHWIVRAKEHCSWFAKALDALVTAAQSSQLELKVIVSVTGSAEQAGATAETVSLTAGQPKRKQFETFVSEGSCSGDSSRDSSEEGEQSLIAPSHGKPQQLAVSSEVRYGRPSVEWMIRPTVEAAVGETAVVVCGGTSLVAQARTCVASLSDERAVHKGTGAQGIFLFTETYGW